jgi:hypothetical protein
MQATRTTLSQEAILRSRAHRGATAHLKWAEDWSRFWWNNRQSQFHRAAGQAYEQLAHKSPLTEQDLTCLHKITSREMKYSSYDSQDLRACV